MDNALQNEEHKQLTLKLRLVAMAKGLMASDARKKELANAQLNRSSAFELADMVARSPWLTLAGGSRMGGRIKNPDGSVEIHVPHLFCPVSILGKRAPKSKHGGKIAPQSYRTQLHVKTEKCGETIRIGKSRSARNARQKNAGESFAQLLRAGQWHSSAYPLRPYLGVEETKAMASILTEASDDEGPGRGEPREEGIP